MPTDRERAPRAIMKRYEMFSKTADRMPRTSWENEPTSKRAGNVPTPKAIIVRIPWTGSAVEAALTPMA